MTRRGFLAGAGATALTLSACTDAESNSVATATTRPPSPASGRPEPVVIVGAGLAGLSAASRLAAEGVDAVVLEASDRVGGRTWTLRDPFTGDQHSDAGAEFVNGQHTRLRALADELGLALDDSSAAADNPLLVHRDGQTMEMIEYFVRSAGALEGVQTFRVALDDLVGGIDVEDPTHSEDAASLDDTSVGEALDDLDLSAGARFLMDRQVLDEYMVDPYDLSLLYFLQVNATNWEETASEAWRIRGGAQQVAERLAARLERVEAGRAVRRIDDRGDRVVLHTDAGTLAARHVVIATPLRPLRSVEFDAPLPRDLAEAVDECGYGVGGKTMLQYDHRWWRDAGWSGAATSDLDIGSLYEATVAQEGRAGILNTYTAGPAGLAAGDRTAAERIANAERDVTTLMANDGEVVGSASVMWHREQLAGGTYVAFGPGQVHRFWKAVRTPVGNLHFAGEHTDTRSGYMEGAIRSGERAAEEVLERR